MKKNLLLKFLPAFGLTVFAVFSILSIASPTRVHALTKEEQIGVNYCQNNYADDAVDDCIDNFVQGMANYDDDTYCGVVNQACSLGQRTAAAAAQDTKPNKDTAKQKAQKAKEAQKKAEKAEKAAKKEAENKKEAAQKICKAKGKTSSECKKAQKAADEAAAKLKTSKATSAVTRSVSKSLSAAECKPKKFFGLTPWYAYLGDEFTSSTPGVNNGGPCTLKCFNFLAQDQPNDCGVKHSDIPYVLLAVVDSLLRAAGIVAVIFVIVGAIKYITSSGNPEQTASAQSTLVNALIGLAIALVAVAFISFIGNRLT